MMPVVEKAFDLMGNDIVDIPTEIDALQTRIGAYDEKRSEESKTQLLRQIDDEERANLILCKMKKQKNK